jgi:hypothetical protein
MWDLCVQNGVNGAVCNPNPKWNDDPPTGCGDPITAQVWMLSYTMVVSFVMVNARALPYSQFSVSHPLTPVDTYIILKLPVDEMVINPVVVLYVIVYYKNGATLYL